MDNPAKAKKRKWVKFERQYSNAMWHTDWHVIRDFRLRDLNLITYLDDASRCVPGYGAFREATGPNAVEVLRQAIGAFGRPASIMSDNDPVLWACGAATRQKERGRRPSLRTSYWISAYT